MALESKVAAEFVPYSYHYVNINELVIPQAFHLFFSMAETQVDLKKCSIKNVLVIDALALDKLENDASPTCLPATI